MLGGMEPWQGWEEREEGQVSRALLCIEGDKPVQEFQSPISLTSKSCSACFIWAVYKAGPASWSP